MESNSNITTDQSSNSNRNKLFYLAFFVITALFALLSIRVVFSPQKKDNQTVGNNQPPTINKQQNVSIPRRGEVLSPKQLVNSKTGISLSLTPPDQTVSVSSEFTIDLDLNRLNAAPDAVDVILPHNPQMFEFVRAASSHTGYALVRTMTPEGLIVLSLVKTGNVVLTDGFVPKDFLRLGRITLKALKVGKEVITPVYNASSVSTLVSYKDKVGNQLSEVQGTTIVVK